MTKDMNLKFGMHAPRESPVMTPEYLFEKGVWPGSRHPINFWALNAYSPKMTKDTNFKFGKHAPRESPVVTPEYFFRKGGVARAT